MGIEPTWPAWKAGALPLSYTRRGSPTLASLWVGEKIASDLVGRRGFEPLKAVPLDLQSNPVGRLGTFP